MGQYTYLVMSKHPKASLDPSPLHLFNSKYHVGLLWLACFRTDDLQDPRASALCCAIGKAREQFEEGITILKSAFPATNFQGPLPDWDGADIEPPTTRYKGQVMPAKLRDESYVDRFRRILQADGGSYLILSYDEMYGTDYDTLLKWALMGFDDPGQLFVHGQDLLLPGVQESGPLSWCHVLRILCGWSRPFRGELHEHPTELFVSHPGCPKERMMLLGSYMGARI